MFPIIGFQIITESNSLDDLPCLERLKFIYQTFHCTLFCLNSNTYFNQSGPCVAAILNLPGKFCRG